MKIIEWMQKRLNGNNGKKKPSSIAVTHYMIREPLKEEFNDWPQALLAIGTLGTNNLKEDSDHRTTTTAEDSPSLKDCEQEFTLEEVGNLQNELSTYIEGSGEREGKENETTFSDESNTNRVSFNQSSSRGKDRCLDHNRKSGVGKKPLSFLLKKMFVCRSGFQPSPPFLKDPLSTESRMEKILRAILQKKIYPQGSSSTVFVKKYLKTGTMRESGDDGDYDDEDGEEFATAACNGCKWVKTDAEYIVLEI